MVSFLLAAVIMLCAAGICPVPGMLPTAMTADAAAKTRVVVLDPGHGGWEKGACYYGMQEKVLNLKIARYCQAELNTYANVKVVMTRTSDRAVSSGGTSADLQARPKISHGFWRDGLPHAVLSTEAPAPNTVMTGAAAIPPAKRETTTAFFFIIRNTKFLP